MALKIPTVLAFERKINPSDGFLYGTDWDDREKSIPLKLVEKSVRGTKSHRVDPKQILEPNLQTVDYCSLPQDCDTLKMIFTVKFLGRVGQPSSCNEPDFQNSLNKAVASYKDQFGFVELGKRYAQNIANARFLWRNRVGSESIEVEVHVLGSDQNWKFNGKSYSIRNFEKFDHDVESLGKLISKTLSGDDSITIEVTTYAKVENGQEVFPSEELVMDKTGRKSKVLYSVDGIAAMHSPKIGNAIRTIDTWYPEYSDPNNSIGPIAVEPYGAVTTIGKAFRAPTDKDKVDFYTLFDKFASGVQLDNDNNKHFVMSVLIRGGVFGKGDK